MMQVSRFINGGFVAHKVTLAGLESRYSIWVTPQGILSDAERKDSRNRCYPVPRRSMAWERLQSRAEIIAANMARGNDSLFMARSQYGRAIGGKSNLGKVENMTRHVKIAVDCTMTDCTLYAAEWIRKYPEYRLAFDVFLRFAFEQAKKNNLRFDKATWKMRDDRLGILSQPSVPSEWPECKRSDAIEELAREVWGTAVRLSNLEKDGRVRVDPEFGTIKADKGIL